MSGPTARYLKGIASSLPYVQLDTADGNEVAAAIPGGWPVLFPGESVHVSQDPTPGLSFGIRLLS